MHATGNKAGRAPPTGPRALTQNRSSLNVNPNSSSAAVNGVDISTGTLSPNIIRTPIKISLGTKNASISVTSLASSSSTTSNVASSSSSAIPVQTGFIARLDSSPLPLPPSNDPPSPSPPPPQVQEAVPPWPGLPSKGRAQRTVYDPYLDKAASSSSKKANECVHRNDAIDQEYSEDEPSSSQSRDPRSGRLREGRGPRKLRAGFHEVMWSWDTNSTEPAPPPPPRAILITNLNPLTPSATIRRQFSEYGHIEEFSTQIDPLTGAPLGICWIKYSGERQAGSEVPGAGEKAVKQVMKAASRSTPNSPGIKVGVGTEGRVVDVFLDPHNKLCKKRVQEELDRRRGITQQPSSSPASMSPPKPDSPSKDSFTGGVTPRSTGLNGLPFTAKHGLPPRPDVHPLPSRSTFTHSAGSPSAATNTTLPTPVHSSIPSASPLHPSQDPSSSSSSSRPLANGSATPVHHPSLPQRPQLNSTYLPVHAPGIGHGSLHPLPQAVQAQKEFTKVRDRKDRRSPTPEWKKRDISPVSTRKRDDGGSRDWRERSRSRSRSPIINDWRDKDRSRSRGRSETRSWSRERSRSGTRSPVIRDWRSPSEGRDRKRSWSRSRSRERSRRSPSYHDRDRRRGGPYQHRPSQNRQSPSATLRRPPLPSSPHVGRNRRSRSPPTSLSSGSPQKSLEDVEAARQLAENGNDHVRIKKSALPRVLLARGVMEEVESELRGYFDAFGVDKVLRDSNGWYVTFTNPMTAKRCRIVLEHRPFMMHHPPLAFIVSPAPPLPPPAPAPTTSVLEMNGSGEGEDGILKAAVPIVMASLKEMFREELKDRVAGDKMWELVDSVSIQGNMDTSIGLAAAVDTEVEVENGPSEEVDELVDDETSVMVVESVKIEQMQTPVPPLENQVQVQVEEVVKGKKGGRKSTGAGKKKAVAAGTVKAPSKKSTKSKKALQALNIPGAALNGLAHADGSLVSTDAARPKKRKVAPGVEVDSDLDDLLLLGGGEVQDEVHDVPGLEGDEVDLLMNEIRERPGPPPKKKHKQSKNATFSDSPPKPKATKKGASAKSKAKAKAQVVPRDVDAALELELGLEPELDPVAVPNAIEASEDELDFGHGQTANRSVNEEAAFDLEAELGVGLDESPVGKKEKKLKQKRDVDLDVEAELLKAVEEDDKDYSSAGVVDVDEELALEVDLVEAGEEDHHRQEQKSRKRSRSVLDEMDLDLEDLGLDLGLTAGLEQERHVSARTETPGNQPTPELQTQSVQDQRPFGSTDISLVSGRARKKPKTLLWNGGDANGMMDYGELDKELFGELAVAALNAGGGGKKKRQSKGAKADKDGAYHFSVKGSGPGAATNGGTGAKQKDATPSGTPNGTTSGRTAKSRTKKAKHHAHSSHALSATPAAGPADEASAVIASAPLAPLVIPIAIGQRPTRPTIPSLKELEESDEITREQEKRHKSVKTKSSPVPPDVTVPGALGRSPSPDPINLQLALDDEELFFLKAGLARRRGEDIIPIPTEPTPNPHENGAAKKTELRVHRTGTSRTEGYYKIPEALKSAYLPQRNRAVVLDQPNAAKINAEAAGLAGAANSSSRSNRVNTRRLVQGMEQAKNAMGGDAQTTQLQFNQLRARKKQLIFARSPIHDWGLYAMEAIPQGEMVIEYVGEVIRAQVADKREKWYERIGIGSSYLFRVDEDSVVDATKKGNLGRLINHSCTPNCNAKIIVVNSQKKIVIYAKSSIEPGEEITYDYHFPLEQEKIPCLCGSSRCRGFLN